MMTHHSTEGGGESWATAAWEASTAEDQEVRAEERKRSETFKRKRAEDPARHQQARQETTPSPSRGAHALKHSPVKTTDEIRKCEMTKAGRGSGGLHVIWVREQEGVPPEDY